MLLSLQRKLFLAAAAVVWLAATDGLGVPEKGILLKYGKRDENFDNKIGKSAWFKTNHGWSLPYCAVMCQRDGSCVSFFYDKKSKECQGQETNIEDHTQVHDSPGTKYYKMYQRRNFRSTPKLIEEFNNMAFFDSIESLDEISNESICLKRCQDTIPGCVSVNFVRVMRQCRFFNRIPLLSGLGYKSIGAVYYRVGNSFCSEDEDYIYFPVERICLKYFQQNTSWNEADLACKVSGARLAGVQTKEIKKALQSLITQGTSRTALVYAHVGIKDEKNDGVYVDRENRPIDERFWINPFKDHQAENCINLACSSICRWNVVDCDTILSGFICAI